MKKKFLYLLITIVIASTQHNLAIFEMNLVDLNRNLSSLEVELQTLKERVRESAPTKTPAPQKPITPKAPAKSQPKSTPTKAEQPQSQQPQKPKSSASKPGEQSYEDLGKLALQYTNEFRAKNKKPMLEWNQKLADLSTEHSKYMASKNQLSHDGFDGRFKRSGFMSAAENVFFTSYPTGVAKSAVDGWIKSEGHRKNLLGDYKYCGIGVSKSPQGYWYFTQIFGK